MGSRIRSDPNHVFEFFCEIEIPSSNSHAPWITWKFPPNYKDEETLKSVPEFAYPCEFNNNAVHHFSFVLTNIDSKWTFGFCRHAPNSSSCFVLLSYLPWHEIFYKVLNHAADLSHKEKIGQNQQLQTFLETMYKVSVPDPGLELHVNYGQNEDFVAVCPDHHKLPTIPENRNMTEYFNAVDAHNMMVIFASMLHERRILVTSKKLSRLSSCIQAANALIYPMHWQHIFIPILPKHLLDYLSAPMPFLIGVPSSTFTRIKTSDMGDVVVLDADNNKVETPFADLDTLPSEILQSLRHDLKRPQEMLGDTVARAFLKALVKLIGGYWNALKLKPGEKISFSSEMFLQTRPAPMQPFLEKMLNLQIFQQFIESRLKMLNSGRGVSDEFEFELTVHEDKASTRLRNQYKDWVAYMKKEGGAFFKNVRTKMKDTSKKAYRDIRSKMKEMHNHKVGLESNADHAFRRRGNSVPGIFSAVDGEQEKSFANKEEEPHHSAATAQSINSRSIGPEMPSCCVQSSCVCYRSIRKKPAEVKSQVLFLACEKLKPVNEEFQECDEYDAIGQNVAAKLRSMKKEQRIVAEKIIHDALYYGQMEKLSGGSSIQLCQFSVALQVPYSTSPLPFPHQTQ